MYAPGVRLTTDTLPRPPRRLTKRLSAAFVRTASPGFYCDGGHGLNLRVDPSGARRWVQRLVIRGHPRMLGLGGYPLVSLAEAREAAVANRQRARAGGDPLAERRHRQGLPTVEEAAAAVLAQQRPGWRNAKHAREWPRSLRAYAFPRIGALSVSMVTTADVLAILTPIWHDKPETARRVRQRLGAVMKWAVAMGYRQDNPAGDALGQALGRQQVVVQHMRALPHGAVADALATVRASQAAITTKDAFEFLVVTATRSGEVRLATWDEMDLAAGVWTIPAGRMKAMREHRVPLSGRALTILHDIRRRSEGTGLVFRSPREKPLSDMTLSKLIKELGIAAVPHGFRSSFRDWAGERTHYPREVVEAALAHVVQNKVEAAYARSDLFERRRQLMDDWAAYLSGARGHVVPLHRKDLTVGIR